MWAHVEGRHLVKTSAENLVRHRSGKLYLNAKIAGSKVRVSLETDNLKEAKVRRDAKLQELRQAAARGPATISTIGDALNIVEKRVGLTVRVRKQRREI